MRMKEQWLNTVRKLLQDYRKEAPEGLLDDVKREMSARRLVADSSGKSGKPSRTRPLRRVALVAASVALCLLLGGLYFESTRQGGPSGQVSRSAPSVATSPHPASPRKAQPLLAKVFSTSGTSAGVGHQNRLGIPVSEKTGLHNRDTATTHEVAALSSVPPEPKSATVLSDKVADGEVSSEQGRIPRTGNRSGGAVAYGQSPSFSTREKKSSFRIGASFTSTPMNMVRESSSGLVLADARPYGDVGSEMVTRGLKEVVYGSDQQKTRARHRQPVKVGISVSYPLNDLWNLQAGLTYSRLSSDLTQSNSAESEEIHQILNDVGLQLALSRMLWQGKRFGVYATAGGGAEKMVSGKSRTEGSPAYGVPASETSVKIPQLQWSLHATGGLEYKLTGHTGVYLEPGVAWYLKNGTKVPTLYQDKPFQFHLQMGLRWTLRNRK